MISIFRIPWRCQSANTAAMHEAIAALQSKVNQQAAEIKCLESTIRRVDEVYLEKTTAIGSQGETIMAMLSGQKTATEGLNEELGKTAIIVRLLEENADLHQQIANHKRTIERDSEIVKETRAEVRKLNEWRNRLSRVMQS